MLSHRTDGKVIFASGSSYFPVTHKDVTYEPGQGNNMYIFPGLGLGAILSKVCHVSDAIVEQASIALASSLTEEEKAAQTRLSSSHALEISVRRSRLPLLDRHNER